VSLTSTAALEHILEIEIPEEEEKEREELKTLSKEELVTELLKRRVRIISLGVYF
jgi:hypothetical protein